MRLFRLAMIMVIKEVETISETATIYFLVNKSNIRTTEKVMKMYKN